MTIVIYNVDVGNICIDGRYIPITLQEQHDLNSFIIKIQERAVKNLESLLKQKKVRK